MPADGEATRTDERALIGRASVLTVGAMLRNQARDRPERIAVDDGSRQLSFAVFNERVNRTANLLASRGVARGERVALCSENRIEYLELAFAAAKLGAILCTLNWRLTRSELDYCVALVTP